MNASVATWVREHTAASMLPVAMWTGSALAVALCAVALAGFVNAAAASDDAPAFDEPPTAPAPAQPRAASLRMDCAHCGVVESVERTEAAAGRPAAYVFTVRLRDGTRHVSTDGSRSGWQVGERIMLIGSAPHARP